MSRVLSEPDVVCTRSSDPEPPEDSADVQGTAPSPVFVFGLAGLLALVFFSFGYVVGRNSVPSPAIVTPIAAVSTENTPPKVEHDTPLSPANESKTVESTYTIESFTRSVAPSQVTEPVPTSGTAETEQVVYVTKSGGKYHRAGCRYLSKSAIPISLNDAIGRYSPCSVCRPPATSGTAATGEPVRSQLRQYESTPDSSRWSSDSVDRNPYGERVTGHTATGIPTYTGPRGGHYHYSKSGKKVYERKK